MKTISNPVVRATVVALLAIIVGAVALMAASEVAVPPLMSIQGKLTDAAGEPVADGEYEVTFCIYDSESGGSELWSESRVDVVVEDGAFGLLLGEVTTLSADIFSSDERWLGIQIEGEGEMTPRSRLSSVPWSIRAAWADTAVVALEGGSSPWRRTGDTVYVEHPRVGIGTSSPAGALHVHNEIGQGDLKLSGVSDDGQTYSALYLLGLKPDGSASGWTVAHKKRTGTSLEDGLEIGNWLGDDYSVRMLLQKDGNVGIGTIDPKSKLHVNGCIETNGTDFVMKAGGDRGVGGRALVHGWGNALLVNFDGDFAGGVQVQGPGLFVDGILGIGGGADIAEPFPISGRSMILPGAVVVIDKDKPGHLRLAAKSYDTRVAGVVSGAGGVNTGLILSQNDQLGSGQNVALSGRVYVQASSVNGPISPGDFLTTSDVPGFAMKATDPNRRSGAVLGKAMTSLTDGTGLVLVLVNLQ